MDKDIQLQIEEIRDLITVKQGEIKKFHESKALTILSGSFVGSLFVAFGSFALAAAGVDSQITTNVVGAAFTVGCVSIVPLFIESHKATSNEYAIGDYNDQILELKQMNADITISEALDNNDFSNVSNEVIDYASKESLQHLASTVLNGVQIPCDSDKDISEESEDEFTDAYAQEADIYSHVSKMLEPIY